MSDHQDEDWYLNEYDTPPDTLAEWIYSRQRNQNPGFETPWAELGEADVAFWNHEAKAYRRAVQRNGFRDYDKEMGTR